MRYFTLFDHLQDFDNEELSDCERREQLVQAVHNFNEEHNTTHDPDKSVSNYLRGNFKEQYGD